MKVVIFGASGKTGQIVTQLCLQQSYSVRAFVHTAHLKQQEGLDVVQGDIHDPEAVNEALLGCDAVVSCLGSWGTKTKNIVSTGTEHIISAMQQHGVRRIITLTGSDAITPGQQLGFAQKLLRVSIKLGAGKILADGERHIELLTQTGLDWTVIRSPIMTSSQGAAYVLKAEGPALPTLISRRAVAQAMVDQITDTAWLRQAPVILAK